MLVFGGVPLSCKKDIWISFKFPYGKAINKLFLWGQEVGFWLCFICMLSRSLEDNLSGWCGKGRYSSLKTKLNQNSVSTWSSVVISSYSSNWTDGRFLLALVKAVALVCSGIRKEGDCYLSLASGGRSSENCSCFKQEALNSGGMKLNMFGCTPQAVVKSSGLLLEQSRGNIEDEHF